MLEEYQAWQCRARPKLEPVSSFPSSLRYNKLHLNLIAPDKLVDVPPRSSIEQQTGQIKGAFPRLEAALVHARAEIRGSNLINHIVVRWALL